MAKNSPVITDSKKVFGGSKLLAGNYIVVKALVTEETNPVDATKTYHLLQVVVKDAATQVECESVLPLNGIWRARRAQDGSKHQASGDFVKALATNCTGKSFAEVVAFINANYAGKTLAIAYDEYPSASHNGFATVPIINLVG